MPEATRLRQYYSQFGAGFVRSERHSSKIDALLKRIKSRLSISKFCVVFENELERVWPKAMTKSGTREAAIEAFAKANDLCIAIHDPGFSVTFRKLNGPS
jgi:hypothetical protein